jgi:hypothetical protein
MQELASQLVGLGAHRVEVVASRNHREASDVAERVPLARGWARQLDYVQNPLFYSGTLTWPRYLAWLHERAVDHVAVPRDEEVLDFGSSREAELLRSGDGPLAPVWQDDHWQVYAVPQPVPVAVGVVAATRTEVVLDAEPGTVDVHVRWSRWLSVRGPACVERSGDHVRLRVSAPGRVVLGSSLRPHGHC